MEILRTSLASGLLALASAAVAIGCQSTSTASMTEKPVENGSSSVDSKMMRWPWDDYNAKAQSYPEEIRATWPLVWEKCGTAACHGSLTQAFMDVKADSGYDLVDFEILVEEMAEKDGSGILNAEIAQIAQFLFYASQHDWPMEPSS